MNILAFSDLHASRRMAAGLVAQAATADLVIAAGDFCNHRQGLDAALGLLAGITVPIVAVPGNAESADELRAAAPAHMTVLHGEACELAGLRFFGLGYGVPPTPFGDWSCDLTEAEAGALLAGCESADILVLHSPPKGLGDRTGSGLSIGSQVIHDAIARIQPRLAVCGHVHESWGVRGMIGATQVVNLGPAGTWFEMEAKT